MTFLSQPIAPYAAAALALAAWFVWPRLRRAVPAWFAGRGAMTSNDGVMNAAQPIEARLAAYACLYQCLTDAGCRAAAAALDKQVLPHLFHEQPRQESSSQ
jgi:hypothetical protein